jgi:hypothetical protein
MVGRSSIAKRAVREWCRTAGLVLMEHWNWGNILAWIVVTVDGGASIGYSIVGDWKRSVLWFCWGLGTAMVTLLK